MKPTLDRADMPVRIRSLPVNDAGYPGPWFVATIDGKPDFRVIERGRIEYAIRNPVCWVCGGPRLIGAAAAFVIGPMCAINHVTAEPPSHVECAEYSATHCPFLTIPSMHRRESRMPEEARNPAGTMIKREGRRTHRRRDRRHPGRRLMLEQETGSAPRFPSLEASGFELSSGPLGPTCRGCGCSDRRACPGGCAWVEDPEGRGDFCSRCLIDLWNDVDLPLEAAG